MKHFFPIFAQYSGLNMLAKKFMKDQLFVIMYHSVHDAGDTRNQVELFKHISIEKGLFETHMRILKENGHTFITPSMIPDVGMNKISKPTIIYFDDGYKDNLTVALPILKKYSIPATIFVTTGLIERTEMLWTIALKELLKQKGVTVSDASSIISELKTLSDEDRKNKVAKLYGDISDETRLRLQNIFLTWDEVKALYAQGIEIGSHSVSHCRLNECDENKIMHELVESKKKIERILGKPIYAVSFPHGRHSSQVLEGVRKAGYLYATSIKTGVNTITSVPPVFLKNVPISVTDSQTVFKAKLYGLQLIKKYAS